MAEVVDCRPQGRLHAVHARMLSALLLQVFYGIRSERQLMEQIDYTAFISNREVIGSALSVIDPSTFQRLAVTVATARTKWVSEALRLSESGSPVTPDQTARLLRMSEQMMRLDATIAELRAAFIIAADYMLDYIEQKRVTYAGYKPSRHATWDADEAQVKAALAKGGEMSTEQANNQPLEVRIEDLRDECVRLAGMTALSNQRVKALEAELATYKSQQARDGEVIKRQDEEIARLTAERDAG